jgi:DNA-binding NarL/FixJ family response regulator
MKILILDDHDAIRMYVNQLVASIVPNATIFLSNSIESAISSINATSSVDFVICDLELNFGCSTVIPELCNDRKIPYMIYSSHVNMVLIQELEKYHVRSYVSKTSGIEALRSGVDALLNGKKYQCSLVKSTIESKSEFKETEKLELTKGQKAALEVLIRGFNREEAAEILNISLNTLNNHIARAREINNCENFEELLRRYRFWDLMS